MLVVHWVGVWCVAHSCHNRTCGVHCFSRRACVLVRVTDEVADGVNPGFLLAIGELMRDEVVGEELLQFDAEGAAEGGRLGQTGEGLARVAQATDGHSISFFLAGWFNDAA